MGPEEVREVGEGMEARKGRGVEFLGALEPWYLVYGTA